MHYLSSIKISNYRSFCCEEFPLSEFTALVGYNNVGKSNLLSAIKWLLKPTPLKNEDFNDSEKQIEIEGIIKGIDDDILEKLGNTHRTKIIPFIENEVIRIKRIQYAPNDSTTKTKLRFWNPQKREEDDPWDINPSGIDQAFTALFPEPIEIGAMEDANEDVSKSKTSTTIGKLISEIITPIEEQYGDEIKESLEGLKERLEAKGENRPEELKKFDTEATNNINDFFPGISIKLHVPAPEIKEVFKAGTIKVFEDSIDEERDVNSMGHGAQRSIQMALIRYLAEVHKNSNNSRTILLIDEPELYLHPQAVEYIRMALKKLSKTNYQIVFSTHSPQMIHYHDIGSTLIVRKEADKGTCALKRLNDVVEEIIEDESSQLKTLFEFSNSSQFLFCDRVILAEGKTEQRLLSKVYESVSGKTLNAAKIGLISLGGVNNIPNALNILNAMGIPALAIVDLDFAFRAGIRGGIIDSEDPDVLACKELCLQLPEKYLFDLDADGFPKHTGPRPPCEGFNILATDIEESKPHIENLHQKLLRQKIWLWKKGSFDDHLGIESKNERAWSEFACKISEEGTSCIKYCIDIEECFACV